MSPNQPGRRTGGGRPEPGEDEGGRKGKSKSKRQKPLSSSPTDSKGPAGKGAAPGAGGEARSRIETEMKESAEERRARRVKEIIAEKTQKKAAAS